MRAAAGAERSDDFLPPLVQNRLAGGSARQRGAGRHRGRMLTEASTKQNRYEAILDRLFPLAGGYSASTSVEGSTVISGRFSRTTWPNTIRSSSRRSSRPPSAGSLDRIKSQTIDYLENGLRYSSDEELGKSVLYEAIFAGTPYGHIPAGHVKSVKSITLDNVRKFYQGLFTRDRLVVGLGGGYDHATLNRLCEDLAALPGVVILFGNGGYRAEPGHGRRHHRQLGCRHRSRSRSRFMACKSPIVEKDGPGHGHQHRHPIDVLRGQADFYPLAVANSWLGEHRHPGQPPLPVIRELRGLNYGDYSYIEHFANGDSLQFPQPNDGRRQQIFEIWLRAVPHEVRHFVLREAMHKLKMLVDGGLDAKKVAQPATRAEQICAALHPDDAGPAGLRPGR